MGAYDKSANKSQEKLGILARAFDKLVGKVEEARETARTSTKADVDIDSSVVLVKADGTVHDVVYFNHERSICGSVEHAGDDRTGKNKQGVHDNEEIKVDLGIIPLDVSRVVFVANIYQGLSKGQDFGQIDGAYIRVLNSQGREELIRYSLTDEYRNMRGIVVGELYRHGLEWKFRAVGQGTESDRLENLVSTVSR